MATTKQQIHLPLIQKVQSLTEDGIGVAEACQRLGITTSGLRSACVRLDLPYPKKPTLSERLIPYNSHYQNGLITQQELADQFNVTQGAVCAALKHLPLIDRAEQRKQIYKSILNYLREHGGYVTQAIKVLGLKTNPQAVRDYAKDLGFELSHYQFAHRRHSLWLTLPGPFKRQHPSTYLVPAVCLSCGTKYPYVNLNNISSGKSTACHLCHTKQERKRHAVVNQSDGTVYRSIMAWTKHVGVASQYQKLRIQLLELGEVTLDGVKYKLETHPISNIERK